MKVICIDTSDTHGLLKLGEEYEVAKETKSHYYIGTGNDTATWNKSRFSPTKPDTTSSPITREYQQEQVDKNAAYQKIVKVEYYKTSDGEEYTYEAEAMQHQLMLNAEDNFIGPKYSELELRDMLDWAKTQPDSFTTLVMIATRYKEEL